MEFSAHVPAGARVLDAPCGTGIFTGYLSDLGFRTLASDISLEMIAVARNATGQRPAQFFQGDLFRLPFRDGTISAVFYIRFMNLVDRPTRIRAVQAMAKTAPVLIVSYYHKYTLKYLGRSLRHKLGLRKTLNPRLSRAELRAEIAETGLTLKQLIAVAPGLSEAWIAVLERPSDDCK
jgi:ubiquinone/menaquinone biosynthesis C-methylase UbiE